MAKIQQKLFFFISIFISLITLTECHGQSKHIQTCREAYYRASDALNSYYVDSNQGHLSVALASVDTALICNEIKSKAVSLKINLLLLSKRYQEGYNFVHPMDSASFFKPYLKYAYENWFLAHLFKAQT